MCKFFKLSALTVTLLICGTLSAWAQVVYGNNKFTDNIYVGITGGASTPLAGGVDDVFPLNGIAGLKLGKDLTPVFGFNVEALVGFGSNGIIITGHGSDNSGAANKGTAIRTASVGLNGTINWSNAIVGYNANRILNISTETGLSYNHEYRAGSDGRDDLGAKAGILVDFKVSDPWHVFVEPAVYWNLTKSGGVTFHKNNSQLAVQVGVVYRFKTSNGTHNFAKYNVGNMEHIIAKLNEQLSQKPTEVIREVPGPTTTITITDTIYINKGYTILFAYDSSELSPSAQATLDEVRGPVTVVGYASPEGPSDYNQALSEERAKVVTDYLVSRGVEVIKTEGAGVDGETSNRIVVVSTLK